MSKKIVRTAGRESLDEFSPMFARLNDNVLSGKETSSEWRESVTDEDYNKATEYGGQDN